ncbi:MAG: pentapeptide repeat-containing protein [Methanothrix sp.]|uniref:Putative membrane protein, ion channel family n=1 Tax=Methanothrix harundinacea TaxID=301375 RepID=A0A101FUD0_9EURY|nr:MAG: Putative membrane protein, ion channel family [Methanothrix harundinacea]KUK94464.1 MAG: Putative membrane protein, ion channel family [Methanothrix harundinacea]MDD3709896.1 pentapeptide repeat-containing protein [Methanothrix sp.]
MKMISALVLTALLLTASASSGTPNAREVVQATDILSKIERGEAISVDNLIVEGDLNLSEIGLESVSDLRPGLGAGLGPRSAMGEEPEIKHPALAGGVKLIVSPISITNSVIRGNVHFDKITFAGPVSFAGTDITGNASFAEARFANHAAFLYTQFGGDANFKAAQFDGGVYFSGDQFTSEAFFGGAEFRDDADFGGSEFGGYAYFGRARFSGRSHLGEARFFEIANFYSARLDPRG